MSFLSRRCSVRATLAICPLAAIVCVASFATNYWAHDSWRPPYAHRSATDPEDNWYAYSYTLGGKERNSYWLDPQGIDRGEPSKLDYAFHCLVGHHGLFSLTPMWLLTFVGLGVLCLRREEPLKMGALAIAAD